jgi:hypothetical protein
MVDPRAQHCGVHTRVPVLGHIRDATRPCVRDCVIVFPVFPERAQNHERIVCKFFTPPRERDQDV